MSTFRSALPWNESTYSPTPMCQRYLPRSGYSFNNPTLERSDYVGKAERTQSSTTVERLQTQPPRHCARCCIGFSSWSHPQPWKNATHLQHVVLAFQNKAIRNSTATQKKPWWVVLAFQIKAIRNCGEGELCGFSVVLAFQIKAIRNRYAIIIA